MTEWHAVHAKIGAEGRALIGIEAAGMGAYLPVELIRKNHRGEREIIWRPLFPRYLFAAIDPGRDLARLRETDGVEDVLRAGGQLARVPDEAIEAIRRAQSAGIFDHTGSATGFKAGDSVRLVDGPFAGLIARVRSARSRHRLQIMVDFVHQLTVGADRLEKIAPPLG
jgi:transcriptional antiterminator RfaH